MPRTRFYALLLDRREIVGAYTFFEPTPDVEQAFARAMRDFTDPGYSTSTPDFDELVVYRDGAKKRGLIQKPS